MGVYLKHSNIKLCHICVGFQFWPKFLLEHSKGIVFFTRGVKKDCNIFNVVMFGPVADRR